MIKTKTKKSGKRLESIVKTATELFLENGFANTSLSEIVNKSGGSLSTIYECFGNKDGLFIAVIEETSKTFLTKLNEQILVNNGDNLEKFLYKFAEIYVKLEFDEQYLKFKKAIFSEILNKNSQFFYIFHKLIVDPIHKILIDFFSKPTIRPKFKGQNLYILVVRFCFIIIEPFSSDKIVFDKPFLMTKSKQKKWAKECVDFFLNGALK